MAWSSVNVWKVFWNKKVECFLSITVGYKKQPKAMLSEKKAIGLRCLYLFVRQCNV